MSLCLLCLLFWALQLGRRWNCRPQKSRMKEPEKGRLGSKTVRKGLVILLSVFCSTWLAWFCILTCCASYDLMLVFKAHFFEIHQYFWCVLILFVTVEALIGLTLSHWDSSGLHSCFPPVWPFRCVFTNHIFVHIVELLCLLPETQKGCDWGVPRGCSCKKLTRRLMRKGDIFKRRPQASYFWNISDIEDWWNGQNMFMPKLLQGLALCLGDSFLDRRAPVFSSFRSL